MSESIAAVKRVDCSGKDDTTVLTSLRLKKFKSWVDTGEMRLAPITGLFGTNSSGKTSILQLLLLLKQTVESTDRAQVLNLGGDQALVDLGTFRDVVHGHSTPGWVEWSLAWSRSTPLGIAAHETPWADRPGPTRLRFSARVAGRAPNAGFGPVVDWFAYKVGWDDGSWLGDRFGIERAGDGADRYRLIPTDFAYLPAPGPSPKLPPPDKFYGFPFSIHGQYRHTNFLLVLRVEFEQLFGRVHYLGPLREHPRRAYALASGPPSDVGPRGERAIEALLAAYLSRERGESNADWDHPVSWIVGEKLRELGLASAFEVRPLTKRGDLFEVGFQTTPEAVDVLLPDLGFGVSQVLPVLVLCYYVPRGSTIILEQPELHLHPSAQAALADVLIDVAKSRNVQIILESHSEHLLLRLQRRMAEERLTPDDVALYFCRMENGESKLTELDIDEFGDISNWPKEFFGNDFAEAAARVETAMRRQIAASAP